MRHPHPKPGDPIFDVGARAAIAIKREIGSPPPMHFVVVTMDANGSLAFSGNYQTPDDLKIILAHAVALLGGGDEYTDIRPADDTAEGRRR